MIVSVFHQIYNFMPTAAEDVGPYGVRAYFEHIGIAILIILKLTELPCYTRGGAVSTQCYLKYVK